MSRNAKQRTTLTDLKEPQQMRELNRQLTWIWDQLLGGLSLKSLNAGTRKVIDSKASAEEVDELGNVVSTHSTAIVQTAQQIELTAGKMEMLGERMEEAESSIRQTPDEIRAAVERVEIGGRNLLKGSKKLDTAEWAIGSAQTVAESTDGFSQIDWKVSGLTADAYHAVKSPVFSLPDGWMNRRWVLSFMIYAADWSATDGSLEARLYLTTGDRNEACMWRRVRLLGTGGAAGDDLRSARPHADQWTHLWAVMEPEEVVNDGPIVITRQPENVSTPSGVTITFKVAAEGDGLTYQWEYLVLGSSGWKNNTMSGNTTDTLTFKAQAYHNGYKYRCLITDAAGNTIRTEEVTLTIGEKVGSIYDMTHGWVGWYVSRNADFSMKAPQLEFADRPSDWSPAPEDADGERNELAAELLVQAGEISANAQRIETVGQEAMNAKSAADAAQGSANANAANLNAVTKRVTTAEASISALDGKIAAKVERTEFNALNQTVADNRSEFVLTADGINQRVTDEVERLQAQIDVNSEGTLLEAGRTVGGRNYLLNSKGPYVATGTGSERYLFPWPCASQEEAASLYGKTVTVSFDYETAVTSGSFRLSTYDTWQLVEEFDSYGRSGHVAKTIQVANATARDANFLYIRGTWTGSVTFSNVKVETGDYATDWSPHPQDASAGLDTGTDGGVRVKITKEEFDVDVPGEDGDFRLNEAGGYLPVLVANSVTAPNVAPRYDGPSALYVNPNATGAQMAEGNYFRSLADALAKLNRRWVGYDVTINLAAGMTEYGALNLTGVSGGGQIVINGSGAKLVGGMSLYYGSARVMVNNLKVDMTGSTGITADGWIKLVLQGCVITGRGSGYGVYSTNNAGVTVTGCEIYDCERSLYGIAGGEIDGYACKGNCRVGANRSTLYLHDFMPCDSPTWAAGTWAGQVLTANISVDQGSKPTVEPEPTTVTYNYQHSDSYRGGWSYFSDEDIRQGYDGGTIYGVIWFDAATIRSALNGKTVKQASLRLQMADGVGRGVAVSVQLYGTNMAYSGRSGAPGLTTSYGTIGTTEPGEVSEITIPTAVISDITAGRIQALVLKSDDTELYKDRFYSKNYARFAGSTTAGSNAGICPRLTVVYQ